jgi:HAD superfamily hydrolase (TIGR01509 family)
MLPTRTETLAVLFDCDGTLVNSEVLCIQVMVDSVRPFGLEIPVDEALRRFKGGKMADCVAYFERELGHPLPADYVQNFRKECRQVFEERLEPIEGARELLEQLELPYCIASSAPREKIDVCLRVTGLAPFFVDRIFSAYEVGIWKPDPGLFLHAAEALDMAPEECAVVEDSILGVRAGIAAGMRVFMLAGEEVPSELADSVEVIERLSDLTPLLSTT